MRDDATGSKSRLQAGEPAASSQAPPEHRPYIPAETSLPEITIKALILGLFLAVILAGANAYLGLFAGMTVSASIPAAVISLGLLRSLKALRLAKQVNILENNIVQTSASAGESLAAGVIFTFPALVMMGVWDSFDMLQVSLVAGLGGVIGVLFTIPLRRALIARRGGLQFPEGVATAEVLETGERGGGGALIIALAGIAGAVFKFWQTGLRIFPETFETAARIVTRKAAGVAGTVPGVEGGGASQGTIAYFGTNLSPALLSVGYIVGINIASLVFIGGALNWLVAIPLYAAAHPWPAEGGTLTAAADWANQIWSSQTRYIGVGAMVVGGLWALLSLRGSIVDGIRSGLQAARGADGPAPGQSGGRVRTDRDTPMKWVLWALLISLVPIFLLYLTVIKGVAISLLMAVIMLLAGFLFSAVAAYMAGLVGSSNNPISGVTISTILLSSLLLLVLGVSGDTGPQAAIFIGAVVCCAAAIAGDNMQDLKTGYLVGATPWKQQVMQGIGTVSSALIMAPVLMLLLTAYGFGEPTAEHPNPLTAPQATLMASVARGVFERNLPWAMVAIGALVGVVVIALDQIQRARGASFRFPVLAVAVGIYLPFELSVPILIGGLISLFTRAILRRRGAAEREIAASARRGLLLASGLITGEALVGILMAIPIVVTGSSNVLALFDSFPLGAWPGILLMLAIIAWMFSNGLQRKEV
ncbi:MAG: oligopeptide transporter, OPT family [Candidatus Eisenbacteria bacterium]|nr:oligopeptide transporter, OPT family [Candidatus Eisenbacteria bacterium]